MTPELAAFRDALNYAVQHAPDYGRQRNVDRRVEFSSVFLTRILSEQEWTDAAFTSTTEKMIDPDADRPFRNVLLHIDARSAANIANLSLDRHFNEYLLPSKRRFRVVRGLRPTASDPEDRPHAFKAEIWVEQLSPDPVDRVPD